MEKPNPHTPLKNTINFFLAGKKRIGILTNYRTGSTSFNRTVHSAANVDGRILYEIFNVPKTNKFDYGMSKLQMSPNKAKTGPRHPHKWVFKLMPDHIEYDMEKMDIILDRCDAFVYLIREDFKAQAESWNCWLEAMDHTHHYGKLKEYHIRPTQEKTDERTDQLINNYEFLKECFAKHPGLIFKYENVFHNVHRPYDRTYTYQTEVTYKNYDVLSGFDMNYYTHIPQIENDTNS